MNRLYKKVSKMSAKEFDEYIQSIVNSQQVRKEQYKAISDCNYIITKINKLL